MLVAIAVGASLVGPRGGGCRSLTPRGHGPALLTAMLSDPPCPVTGQAVYNALDDRGLPLDVLDPIADPRGGYLGVYHSSRGAGGPQARIFDVRLAHSTDLVHWDRLRVLVPQASMATLRAIPGTDGYLLAVERSGRHDTVALAYYPSLAAVLGGRASSDVDLPLRFSRLANGTPAFLRIAWNGGMARSVVTLSFHYLVRAGVDREATGVVRGFGRNWRAQRDTGTDQLLLRAGFAGNHGGQRLFVAAGRPWRILEAQVRPQDFATWHLLLLGPGARSLQPLTLHLRDGTRRASFGNPVVSVLPAPNDRGHVLVMTVFVFSNGPAAADAGELIYLRRFP
jgi:hypothetical protein